MTELADDPAALQTTLDNLERWALGLREVAQEGRRAGMLGSLTTMAGPDDRTARVWSADGSGAAPVLSGHEGPVSLAAFDAQGERVATASSERVRESRPPVGP